MGYYTRYELSATKWPDELTNYLSDNEFNHYGITKYGDSFGEACKWYNHEKDMKELSLKFPDIRFTLHGKGEEHGDIWEKHFVNGKMQVCTAKITITIPPFDATKLK